MRRPWLTALLLMALSSAPALAQGCAMCKANAKATPKDGQRAINRAIVIMLVPPLGFCRWDLDLPCATASGAMRRTSESRSSLTPSSLQILSAL